MTDGGYEPGVGERALLGQPQLPLFAAFGILRDWLEEQHLARMATHGFDDVRRSHNAVFANLPADGIRLTALAEAAGITKQAMSELVLDLESKGYVVREPDPDDGRAKRIAWGTRGEAAHARTLDVLRELEHELTEVVGDEAMEQMRATVGALIGDVLSSR